MKKNAGYLVAAVGLLGLAAFLMREPEAPRLRRKALEFPRYPRSHEIERRETRKTLALPAPSPSDSDATEPADTPAPLADPVLVALASPDDMAFVLEASALKDSPIGRMLLACQSPEVLEEIERFEQRSGFRPFEQLERIGVTSHDGKPVMVLSGDFSQFDPGFALQERAVTTVGNARLLDSEEASVAVWKDQVLLVGDPGGVHAALDRLEGSSPAATSSLPSDEAYGEMYGSLSGPSLSRLLPEQLRDQLWGAADRVLLHVDATDDLLLVASVTGQDESKLSDLARAVAGALSLGRLGAVRDDDRLLADLLDESRVIPSQGSFQLEVALPLASVERQLGECAKSAR
ncbi:MAG TPA: hypothetical protein VMG12_29880 [Polyangiaceae bacterium]|nr:hypothetical protein [Polyangiaceae bacterium]